MTALSATIGTGNIAGVATAVVGGTRCRFLDVDHSACWDGDEVCRGYFAVKYRVDKNGKMAGGPMYYIERGLGWKWLAVLFALFGSIAAFGIGSSVQSNSVAAR